MEAKVARYTDNQDKIFKLAQKRNKSASDFARLEKLHKENEELAETDEVREYLELRMGAL